jgi:proteasome lid subunit RPN8/RPN11
MQAIPHPSERTSTVLRQPLRAEIESWSLAACPRESCGLLIGRRDGGRVDVVEVRAARNLNDARPNDRYELDPVDQLAAEEEARRLGLEVVGVWHSHPDHPALPSETDRAHAWSGWSYVIVSVAGGKAREVRSWRLVVDRFVEEELLA